MPGPRPHRSWLSPAVLAILLVLLIAAPGAADSPWGGTPLTAAGRYAICVIAALWAFTQFFPPRQPVRPAVLGTLAALVAVKVAIGLVAPTTGWEGRYTYRDAKGQPHAARFFWRFGAHDHRIDRALWLGTDNFDLHFLNDLETFGYPPYSAVPREREFPLRVEWRAWLHLDQATTVRITGVANGVLEVAVDGRPQPLGAMVALDPGRHELTATLDKPAGIEPAVDLHLIDTATGRTLAVTPDETRRPGGFLLAGLTTIVVFAGALLALAALVPAYQRAGAGGGAPVGAAFGFAATVIVLVWTASLSAESVGRTDFMRAGGDPLLYASDARSILLGDPLVLRGLPLGQAQPFYFYPFYPYVLAVMHAVVGDDGSTVFMLNGLSLALLPVLLWWLGWRELGPLAAAVGFVALVIFIDVYCWPVASFENPALTDLVFTALAFVALNAMVCAFGSPSAARLTAAGAAIGFCSATRPSVLTLIGLAPIGLWAATRAPIRRWVAASAWLMLGVFLALLPFTTRNLVASGRFVVLVNSWIQIPYFLVPPEVVEKPLGFPGLFEAVGMGWEIVKKDPVAAIWLETRKVLFTLGLTTFGPPWIPASRVLWILPILLAVSAWRRRIPPVLLAVLLTFTVSHLLAMVIAAPWTFGIKTILPLHLACLCGAAFLLDRDHRLVAGRRSDDAEPEGPHLRPGLRRLALLGTVCLVAAIALQWLAAVGAVISLAVGSGVVASWLSWVAGLVGLLGLALVLWDLFVLLPLRRAHERRVDLDGPATGRIAVALTCYNDEASIAASVRDFAAHPRVSRVIVVDNNSRDGSAAAAAAAGARVVVERRAGYGQCVHRCLQELAAEDTPLVALCEGDMTFRARDLDKLAAFAAHADVVNGTRIVEQLRAYDTQLSTFMYYGNFFVGKLLEIKHFGKGTFTDVGTTYKLLRREILDAVLPRLDPTINLEFNAYFMDRVLQLGYLMVECPITFHQRVGISKGGNASNWKGFVVGVRMIVGLLTDWRIRA